MPAHAPRSRTGLGRRRRAGFVAPVARVARPEAATATARRAVGGRELPEVAGACRQSRSITQRARGVGAPHPRLSRPGMIVAGRRHGPFIPATPAGLFDPRSSRHHSFVIFLLLLFGAGLWFFYSVTALRRCAGLAHAPSPSLQLSKLSLGAGPGGCARPAKPAEPGNNIQKVTSSEDVTPYGVRMQRVGSVTRTSALAAVTMNLPDERNGGSRARPMGRSSPSLLYS